MKRIAIGLALLIALAGASFAQTKTLTGTVLDYSVGNKGNWEGITIKVGDRTYFVYLNTVDYPAAKVVGEVREVGRVVKVFSTRKITASGRYAGDVIATRVVEIKQLKPKRK